MFKTIMTTFKLTWYDSRDNTTPTSVITRVGYVCCISQGSIKTS